jgi:DNA-binding CsgD family transcriptional regulator
MSMDNYWHKRENRVLLLLLMAEGMTQNEISRELNIHVSHVQTGVRSLRYEHKAKNNVHLIAMAYHNGILIPKGGPRARPRSS